MKTGMYGGSFYPFHTGHLSMIIKASAMVDELFVVISFSKSRELQTSKEDDFPYMSERLRQRWITESVSHLSNVRVLLVEDDSADKKCYNWKKGADDIKAAIGQPIDAIFGSEESYRAIFSDNYPDAPYFCIDPTRKQFPISSSRIREEGVHTYWEYIPASVRPFFLKKIAIVGTESCGKSTLTANLAQYFNTSFVAEYGRTYTDEIGGSNGILFHPDFLHIASQHRIDERTLSKTADKLLFVDSEAVVTQYYSHLYGEGHNDALDAFIFSQDYDLILYLEPDVPWVQDGTRHHGHDDERIQNNIALKKLFSDYDVEIISINGTYEERFDRCLQKINKLQF